MMNEAVIKKTAEVRAFVDLTDRIIQDVGPAGREQLEEIVSMLESIGKFPDYQMPDEAARTVFDEKHRRTLTKLNKMMDLYVGDQWDNPVEVLEWLSFYSGSGSAHASLAAGALQEIDPQGNNQSISSRLSEEFWQLLTAVKTSLFEAGRAIAGETSQ